MNTSTLSVGDTSPTILTKFSQSILNWNSALDHVDTLKEKFKDCLGFDIPKEFIAQITGEFVHVYLGLDDNELLMFFLIDSAKDNKATLLSDSYPPSEEWPIFDIYANYGSPDSNVVSDQLDEPEAARRIANWDLNYQNWIDEMCRDEKPIFQAWKIRKDDLGQNIADYSARFALVITDQGCTPDLVIVCKDTYTAKNGNVVHNTYYDLVRPVPPFKVVEMPAFYLLMYSLASR
nr:hypothetical protein [uncultured Fluviicola sp.]